MDYIFNFFGYHEVLKYPDALINSEVNYKNFYNDLTFCLDHNAKFSRFGFDEDEDRYLWKQEENFFLVLGLKLKFNIIPETRLFYCLIIKQELEKRNYPPLIKINFKIIEREKRESLFIFISF